MDERSLLLTSLVHDCLGSVADTNELKTTISVHALASVMLSGHVPNANGRGHPPKCATHGSGGCRIGHGPTMICCQICQSSPSTPPPDETTPTKPTSHYATSPSGAISTFTSKCSINASFVTTFDTSAITKSTISQWNRPNHTGNMRTHHAASSLKMQRNTSLPQGALLPCTYPQEVWPTAW